LIQAKVSPTKVVKKMILTLTIKTEIVEYLKNLKTQANRKFVQSAIIPLLVLSVKNVNKTKNLMRH